jgi:hypothetical protein
MVIKVAERTAACFFRDIGGRDGFGADSGPDEEDMPATSEAETEPDSRVVRGIARFASAMAA